LEHALNMATQGGDEPAHKEKNIHKLLRYSCYALFHQSTCTHNKK
jgi:hypothetical protein